MSKLGRAVSLIGKFGLRHFLYVLKDRTVNSYYEGLFVYFDNGDFDNIVRGNPLFVKVWRKEYCTKIWCALYVMGKTDTYPAKSAT